MGPKLHEVVVTLRRDGQRTQWGIRLVGGVDLDMPLIITKVCCVELLMDFSPTNFHFPYKSTSAQT